MEFNELQHIVEGNAKSIRGLAVETNEAMKGFDKRSAVLSNEISELKDTVFTLARIVSSHEKRLTELFGYSITGESDRLDLLQRLQKLERRINRIEESDRPDE